MICWINSCLIYQSEFLKFEIMNSSNHTRKFLWIPFVQGLYFFLTAVWPLLHIESFQLVTGFKTDIWLVDTVAFLLIPYAFICFSVAFKFLIVSKPIILT